MFTQVYFHKTRVAYDVHLRRAMKELLPGGHFPRLVGADLLEFLRWEDWKVLGLLNGDSGGENGERIRSRNHFRQVFHTPEAPTADDVDELQKMKAKLGTLVAAEESAEILWVMEKFGSLTSAQLELVSTIIYVDREAAQKGRKPTLQSIACQVHFSEIEIIRSAEVLMTRSSPASSELDLFACSKPIELKTPLFSI